MGTRDDGPIIPIRMARGPPSTCETSHWTADWWSIALADRSSSKACRHNVSAPHGRGLAWFIARLQLTSMLHYGGWPFLAASGDWRLKCISWHALQ